MSQPMWRSSRAAAWPVIGLLLLGLLVGIPARLAPTANAAEGFREEEVRFRSGKLTLRGTILIPDAPGRKPAMALVHGAGPGPREQNRIEAEAFAREGIVTLIYDKRTEGYSQFERSHELLADDALAAVRMMRTHPDVDPEVVGLWGLSEGGWVVPLAASRSDEVAFAVLVAASGVPPARQHSWYLENQLHHQHVSGSMVKAISRTGMRLIVDAGMFAEANHDPVPPLEQLRQPVLKLWGEKDRVEPPAESARIMREALERGGNQRYTIRFFPNAEHGLRASPDGFIVHDTLTPGYTETVGAWTHEVARGEAPGPSIAGPIPEQARLSRPLAPLAWWESGWVQLGATVLPALTFAAYLLAAFGVALARLVHGHPPATPEPTVQRARRWAPWLTITGLATIVGFLCYFGFLIFTDASAVGPMIAGRPIPWLVLQVLAAGASVSTVALSVSWWSARAEMSRVERVRIGVLLLGGAVFVVWATYWGLLVP